MEDENKAIEEETRKEYEAKLALMKKERDNALDKVKEAESDAKNANVKAEKEKMRADNAEQMLGEARKALEESNKRISVLSKKVKTIDDLKEVADAADKAVLDAKQVVELINRRVFQRNSDATRFLNGEIDPNCPLLEENGLAAIVKHVMAVTSGKDRNGMDDSAKKKTNRPKVRVPKQKTDKTKSSSDTESNTPHRRRVYTATILEEMGIDTSNLPKGSKLMMLEAIRQSQFTNNDATRLLVRSRETPDDPLKYTIEYVQAALSLEKKLCVMLYDEGTRDHMLQEEKIFKDSSIVGFVADRAPQYPAIVKDLEGQELLRQACWFHARHYLVDAYLVDSRMEMLLILINALFYIERVFLQEDDQSPEHRLEFRKEWSEPIVDRIMEMLKKMRAAGDEYGQMVHRAVDYILDDEDAFRTFLSEGRIDMHNIAIERCFRHIAMGRRNWLQTGSHFSAQNLAFMFGLLESCKLNKVNFGEYIEDILTRILCGEEVDASFLPCDYVRHFEDGTDAEVTKTSQAVA